MSGGWAIMSARAAQRDCYPATLLAKIGHPCVVISAGGSPICLVFGEGLEERAGLISAAPDLAEALVYVREALGNPVPIGKRHIVREIDAALAKARGES
jgi:hypothetical protein